jgi:hypothetical protein
VLPSPPRKWQILVPNNVGERANLHRLLETGAYSDLVIACKDKVWKVHKAIVLLSSKPLDDKFNVSNIRFWLFSKY